MASIVKVLIFVSVLLSIFSFLLTGADIPTAKAFMPTKADTIQPPFNEGTPASPPGVGGGGGTSTGTEAKEDLDFDRGSSRPIASGPNTYEHN